MRYYNNQNYQLPKHRPLPSITTWQESLYILSEALKISLEGIFNNQLAERL